MPRIVNTFLVGTPGIEPGTSSLSVTRSNHLSYAPEYTGVVNFILLFKFTVFERGYILWINATHFSPSELRARVLLHGKYLKTDLHIVAHFCISFNSYKGDKVKNSVIKNLEYPRGE